jgi:hypothetical protein
MDNEDEGRVGGDAENPEPGIEPGFVQQDTSAYVTDAGPTNTAPEPRPPRTGNVTMYLGAVLIAVLGFLGGIVVGHHTSSTSSSGSAFPSGFPGGGSGFPGGASGSGGGAGGGFIFGTVTKVRGTTVYVKQSDGTVITVTTSGSTNVQVSKSGSVSDLSPGSTVIVRGSSSGQHSIAATTVTEGGLPGLGTGSVPTPASGTGS